MKKVMMSNGEYATSIEDFEDVIGTENLRGIQELIDYEENYSWESVSYWKRAYNEMELSDDEKYQMINEAIGMLHELKEYIRDAKRIDRKKLNDMVDETANQLMNY